MYFIRRSLDDDVDPMNLPSRDKTRTNKNGINLEFLKPDQGNMTVDSGFLEKRNNPFTKERRSVDVIHQPQLPQPPVNMITPRN